MCLGVCVCVSVYWTLLLAPVSLRMREGDRERRLKTRRQTEMGGNMIKNKVLKVRKVQHSFLKCVIHQ